MKKTRKRISQDGFTLIESLMAMAIFTIGILGLFGMQTAAIKENLAANAITIGSTWATDRVERLLAMDYSDPGLALTVGTCADLPESYTDTGWSADSPVLQDSGSTGGPEYRVYWAVANDCTLTDLPVAQRPKYLRVIVTREVGTGQEDVAILNYIVQNI
ncbi:type IV pilus modification PilV family protein [Candidatus Electrothrix sp.]|uniref:type IV pilus modification PilV family protein n=1 Tax=Candidatus Electrothrix sp. TaxID=2170559 RepID=UPI004057ADE1